MSISMKTRSRVSVAFLIGFMVSILLVSMSGLVLRAETADERLKTEVEGQFKSSGQGAYKDSTYELEGGGYIAGSSLFTSGHDIDENQFSKLTKDAQSEFVEDFANACNSVVDNDAEKNAGKSNTVTDDTVNNWWKQLQQKKGMGSKFLSSILSETKPDFVTAKKWYKPFSGPIGTLLAFGSIIALSLIGIVMVADILYITIPPFRLFVSDKEESGKLPVSKIFSHAAIYAVKEVEEGGGDGAKKHSLGIYFKSRVVELILLGICLLYLVQGQIYTVVGWVLDLLSGFTS